MQTLFEKISVVVKQISVVVKKISVVMTQISVVVKRISVVVKQNIKQMRYKSQFVIPNTLVLFYLSTIVGRACTSPP